MYHRSRISAPGGTDRTGRTYKTDRTDRMGSDRRGRGGEKSRCAINNCFLLYGEGGMVRGGDIVAIIINTTFTDLLLGGEGEGGNPFSKGENETQKNWPE